MAWVARRSDGSITGVGFDRKQAPNSPDITILDIDDNQATQVLEGKISLQHSLGNTSASPVQPVPMRRVARRNYSLTYPAMMTDKDISVLISLAEQLPTKAIAVEIGSRLGGSAKVLVDNAPDIKRLYCIESEWADFRPQALHDPAMDTMREHWQLDKFDNCFQFAKTLLSGYKNVRLLSTTSPYDMSWWSETVDFVFEDSSHANPQLRDNLNFWLTHLKSGGIIAGHDYTNMWPDVVTEVDALSKLLNVDLHVQGSIWWMVKP